ncbi:MAG: phage portal protein [Burkholderiales bacterium]
MLTNLNWLAPGKPWPPPSEKARIARYEENEKLFMTQHDKVWKKAFEALAARFKKKNYDAETIFNYHQLLSKKTCDFICSEPPKIETENDTDGLVKLLDAQRFFPMLYELFIDVSRFGDGVVKFKDKGVSIVSPKYWFPIVDPFDLKHVTQDVIAYPTSSDPDGKMTEIYAEIHDVGKFEVRRYRYNADSGIIGDAISSPEIKTTNLKISAIQVLKNLTHSGSIYGVDDYNIVNSIIKKLMWRLHCADTILDKHSEPSMSGPESALQYDEKLKVWYVPLGNYFKRTGPEDPDIEYKTWDGNLESNFKELELLFDQLYILSEMGQAFADAGGNASESSGTALKLRMVSPRIKAQRLVGINHATVKRIITGLAKLNSIEIDYDTLKIYWCDGLPVDEVEQTNTLVAATGGKPIMSQYTAIKKRGLSDTDTLKEIKQIQDEEAAAAPVLDIPRTVNEPEPGDEE